MTLPVQTAPTPTTTTHAPRAAPALRFASVDEYLGPRELRFFGSGYRDVRTVLHDARVEAHPGVTRLRARGGLELGARWSSKGGRTLAPHLSTPDALRFTEQVAATLVGHRHGRGAWDGSWLEEVRVLAGRTPVEDALDRLPVTAALRDAGPDHGEIELDLATMTVRARVRLGRPDPTRPGVTWPGTVREARPGGSSVLAPLRPLAVEDVRVHGPSGSSTALDGGAGAGSDVQIGELRSAAAALVLVGDERTRETGPGGDDRAAAHAPLQLVDVLVTGLQLGQVLLYETDRLDRRDSSTLWMRCTTVHRDREPRPASTRTPVHVELRNSRVLHRAGTPWRCADVVADADGVQLVCSVTHALPVGPR